MREIFSNGIIVGKSTAPLPTGDISISQLFDLVFVHPEVVGNFMEHGKTDFFAELIGVGKILQQRFSENSNLVRQQRQVETRSFRKRNTLVDAVQGVTARIKSFGSQESPRRPLFYDELNVTQLFAKLARQPIDDSADFISKLIVIQAA